MTSRKMRQPPMVVERIAYTLSHYDMTFNSEERLLKDGRCIPMAYTLAEAIRRFNIPVRVIEASIEVTAIGDSRVAQMQPNKRTGFLGHVVVYLPTKHWVVDATLHVQESEVIRLAMPSGLPIYIDFDHRKDDVASVKLERGTVKYTEFRFKGNVWQNSNFPWQKLDILAAALAREAGENL